MKLERMIRDIVPADRRYENACLARWDSLCKPLGGLGRFEEAVARIGAAQRTDMPHAERRAIVIMGADNGVTAEGVSQTGSEVTRQVMENMAAGITTVCVLGRMIRADVMPVDIGLDTKARVPGVLDLNVRRGTGNIAREDAMTREECEKAIEAGYQLVLSLKESGYDLVIPGEMGIGNTTTSAACASVLFGCDPAEVTGRGAGLSSEGLRRKTQVVRAAVSRCAPDPADPVGVIAGVGGLDIAGLTGCFLGAAAAGMPALVDGVIAGVAACFAYQLAPAVQGYLFATHSTSEPAAGRISRFLGLAPVLFADMHLGEGTGAAMYLPLLDQALAVYRQLPSFEKGGVGRYQRYPE